MKNTLLAAVIFSVSTGTAFSESLKMQVDGKDWAATVINTTIVPMGSQQVISLTGKLEGDKISSLSFQIAPASIDAPVGHYELKSGPPQKQGAGGTFNADLVGGDPMEDSYKFQSGILDVTGYDPATHTLSGTFSGQMVNHSGSKKAMIQGGILDAVTIGQ